MSRKRGGLTILALVAVLALLAAAVPVSLAAPSAQTGTAEIVSPGPEPLVSGTIEIPGTATHPNFQFYKLEFGQGATPTSWAVIGPLHTEQVTDGVLGTWDTTTVPDGEYTVKLTVVDRTGNYIETSTQVIVANQGPPPGPPPPNRGCQSCHQQVMPDGAFTLSWEAQIATGFNHPTMSPSGVSLNPTDQVGPQPCLECHAPGTGAREGMGNADPYSLRDIVHPVHLNSPIFLGEFTGNCFTCHNVSGTGVFQVLGEAVEVKENGIPVTVPIPGAFDPS